MTSLAGQTGWASVAEDPKGAAGGGKGGRSCRALLQMGLWEVP